MKQSQKKAVKAGIGLAAGVGLAAVCPPAAAIVGFATFFRSARRFAQTGNVNDARGMITGFGDVSSASQQGDAGTK
jgi:hypothetical protein